MTAPSTIDSRYGRTPERRRRSRLLAILAAIGVAVVVVAWVLWVGLFGPGASLESRDLGYQLTSEASVEVRYEVTVDTGRSVSCAVEALAEDFSIVGWHVVTLPPSDQRTRQFSASVRTTQPAVTGLIYRCWLT